LGRRILFTSRYTSVGPWTRQMFQPCANWGGHSEFAQCPHTAAAHAVGSSHGRADRGATGWRGDRTFTPAMTTLEQALAEERIGHRD
jgi:hypothetical protein